MSETPEQACAQLKARMLSLQLATLGSVDKVGGYDDGADARSATYEPHIGYTPFTDHEGHLLIFVSRLSLHTRDLLANPDVAVMLIDDEQSTPQIFARTRLSYQCKAHRVDDADPNRERWLDACEARHGKTVQLLRSLPDFVLFRLELVSGMFVMGFGKAYHLTGPELTSFDHARSA